MDASEGESMRTQAIFVKTLLYLLAGVGIEVLGMVCLALGISLASKILATYPMSVIFYVMPDTIIDSLSELCLFVVGFLGGGLFWSITLFLLHAVADRVKDAALASRFPT
jgi:hypothetical protein